MNPTELFQKGLDSNRTVYDVDNQFGFSKKLVYRLKSAMWEEYKESADKILINKNAHFWDDETQDHNYFWECDYTIDNVRCKGVEEDWTKMYKAVDACFPGATNTVFLCISERGTIIFGAYCK